MSLFSGRCLSLYGILAMGKYILCKVLLYALIFDTFCIGVSVLNILSLSLHKIVFGSAKSTPVKHRFSFLPLHSPFAIFTDRMMGHGNGVDGDYPGLVFVSGCVSDNFVCISACVTVINVMIGVGDMHSNYRTAEPQPKAIF